MKQAIRLVECRRRRSWQYRLGRVLLGALASFVVGLLLGLMFIGGWALRTGRI